jgi:hypothetical protein
VKHAHPCRYNSRGVTVSLRPQGIRTPQHQPVVVHVDDNDDGSRAAQRSPSDTVVGVPWVTQGSLFDAVVGVSGVTYRSRSDTDIGVWVETAAYIEALTCVTWPV